MSALASKRSSLGSQRHQPVDRYGRLARNGHHPIGWLGIPELAISTWGEELNNTAPKTRHAAVCPAQRLVGDLQETRFQTMLSTTLALLLLDS